MMGMRVDSFSGKERMAKHGCTKYQFETLLSIILEIDSKYAGTYGIIAIWL